MKIGRMSWSSMHAGNWNYRRKAKGMGNIKRLVAIVHRLSEARRYKVLVHARLLVLRQCVIEQYYIERRMSVAAHWVR